MLFNSILFVFFFAVTFLVYWQLRGSARHYFLILASLLFYAVWGLQKEGWIGLRWSIQFVGMVALNYLLIEGMIRAPRWKRSLLALLVGADLLNLFLFKYVDFFLNVLLDLGITLPESYDGFDFFLPLAISFYTFQLLAYGVDVYRGVIRTSVSADRFFLFILFFPQLIAGPIMRASDFMEQIDSPYLDRRRMYDGLWLILGGAIKKVLMADPMGQIVAPIYRQPDLYEGWTLLLAGMGFALQVYSDFSGYTDMARGSARLLGFEIPENFLAPFFARSAKELWNRWHITLSAWLRDYIYFSLGGSRQGEWRTYFNLVVTFTLGGLWHGADYTYLAWGGMWGVLLALERLAEKRLGLDFVPRQNRVLIVLKVALMFLLFSLGAIMFRSRSVTTPNEHYSSARIMGSMLSGIVTNGPDEIREDYRQGGGDVKELESVFGPELFAMEKMGYGDSFAAMFLALLFFHMIQYRRNMFEGLRRYDPYMLTALSALIGGYAIPITVTGAHQFIYFVF